MHQSYVHTVSVRDCRNVQCIVFYLIKVLKTLPKFLPSDSFDHSVLRPFSNWWQLWVFQTVSFNVLTQFLNCQSFLENFLNITLTLNKYPSKWTCAHWLSLWDMHRIKCLTCIDTHIHLALSGTGFIFKQFPSQKNTIGIWPMDLFLMDRCVLVSIHFKTDYFYWNCVAVLLKSKTLKWLTQQWAPWKDQVKDEDQIKREIKGCGTGNILMTALWINTSDEIDAMICLS